MEKVYFIRENPSPANRINHGFGHRDRLGREIGAYVHTQAVDYVRIAARPEYGSGLDWNDMPGDSVVGRALQAAPRVRATIVIIHATRNGEEYGSSYAFAVFQAEADAEAFVAKRLAALGKTAAKKAGK